MSRSYLENLGIKIEDTPWGWNKDDDRQKQWALSREIDGFDERETWNLYYTIDLLMYERLCAYKEIAEKCIDLDFHKFDFNGETLTQRECINRMIKGLEYELLLDDFDERRNDENIKKSMDEVYKIYAICNRSLWW